MSEQPDAARLLAEALRAKAGRTPASAAPAGQPVPRTRRPAATARWVLLSALLLGLLAGVVAGVLTVL